MHFIRLPGLQNTSHRRFKKRCDANDAKYLPDFDTKTMTPASSGFSNTRRLTDSYVVLHGIINERDE
ncbi:uncharacterized protein EAE98_005276 [Botrytis deweyae]|uniref:Uncharacterized protein n=1 Tax=Botrytis deweyae TaxID=2478750 RepID=A0ABQ7INX7_9HELO|nr:uncharacterized protein EAE98_005276 [Botrytis deweyae]KAF7929358.1 hypothetical protein EAE98_005276 [Botrytis deweyae]